MINETWFCYTITSDSGLVYSGATNNVDKRMRQVTSKKRHFSYHVEHTFTQHNKKIANRGTFTRRFKSTKLAILMGPIPRPVALSIEHRMKRFVIRGGGLIGRMKALKKAAFLVRAQNVVSFVDAVGPTTDFSAAHKISNNHWSQR